MAATMVTTTVTVKEEEEGEEEEGGGEEEEEEGRGGWHYIQVNPGHMMHKDSSTTIASCLSCPISIS